MFKSMFTRTPELYRKNLISLHPSADRRPNCGTKSFDALTTRLLWRALRRLRGKKRFLKQIAAALQIEVND